MILLPCTQSTSLPLYVYYVSCFLSQSDYLHKTQGHNGTFNDMQKSDSLDVQLPYKCLSVISGI